MDVDEQTKARVGQAFNKKYTLGRLIGSGGMATVYEATHRNGHRVAIKILHGHSQRGTVGGRAHTHGGRQLCGDRSRDRARSSA